MFAIPTFCSYGADLHKNYIALPYVLNFLSSNKKYRMYIRYFEESCEEPFDQIFLPFLAHIVIPGHVVKS